jgi:hypothetical protein
MQATGRHGLWTPRGKLKEMRESPTAKAHSWFRTRLDSIEKHLAKVQFHGRPMLDEPMKASAVDAVIEEAWDAVEHAPDEILAMIKEMAAEGRA